MGTEREGEGRGRGVEEEGKRVIEKESERKGRRYELMERKRGRIERKERDDKEAKDEK